MTPRQALARAVEIGRGRLDSAVIEPAAATLERLGERASHSPERTVVALLGATGSGKSSILNAIVGENVARVAVTRPTTRDPLAVTFGEGGADLLDWLEVKDRRERADDGTGLIVLDLPDIDSTEAAHREKAARLAEKVDVLVWVLDPQKYADAALHADFLRPLSRNAEVSLVLLNQIDRLPPSESTGVLAHLRTILDSEGFGAAEVLTTSAKTGEGIPALRQRLHSIAREARAREVRARAEIGRAADRLAEASGFTGASAGVIVASNADRLVEACARAAGVDAVVDAVRKSGIREARARLGWVPVRWVRRLRPDPLRRLHLSGAASAISRTSIPQATPVQTAAVHSAAQVVVTEATRSLPDQWRIGLLESAEARIPGLVDGLDRTVASVDLEHNRTPLWWRAVGALQWIWAATMLVGLAWLGVLAVAQWLLLTAPPTPRLGNVPWPTVLALSGALLGILTAVLAMAGARAGAARRAARVRRRLLAAIEKTVSQQILTPLGEDLHEAEEFAQALAAARA